ncbi:MAG: chemotaxis protein CheW [Treponema sp.]|nr:chemotaxis protein CheW [Treponema sp.]
MSEVAEMLEISDEETENEKLEKFLVFSIQGKYYSFPSRLIGEISLYDTVYPLPLVPPYVLGVVNRYSVPYALFDIGVLFHKKPSARNKILIFKDEVDRIAFLADDIIGIADINPESVLIIERNNDTGDLTEAIAASFNWNENDVFILDIQRILKRVSQETEQ